jgi:hypothetical protein
MAILKMPELKSMAPAFTIGLQLQASGPTVEYPYSVLCTHNINAVTFDHKTPTGRCTLTERRGLRNSHVSRPVIHWQAVRSKLELGYYEAQICHTTYAILQQS